MKIIKLCLYCKKMTKIQDFCKVKNKRMCKNCAEKTLLEIEKKVEK